MDPEKSGSITQVSSENFTPEDFCYGVLKGMSTELYQMYMTIQKGTGIKIRRMIGSGNGLRGSCDRGSNEQSAKVGSMIN